MCDHKALAIIVTRGIVTNVVAKEVDLDIANI
jgi:hypothetical protein